MSAATNDDHPPVEDGLGSPERAASHPEATLVGTRFYAVGDTLLDVYTLAGEVVARRARWVCEVKNDPQRVVVGDENRACEIITDREGAPQAVYRVTDTKRWSEFGVPTDELFGVEDRFYLPTEPEYEALERRRQRARETPEPPSGLTFARDVKKVGESFIPPDQRDTCTHCETGLDTALRVHAWHGTVLFGVGITDDEVVNEVCAHCIDLDPDETEVMEYHHPDDPGEFPVDFRGHRRHFGTAGDTDHAPWTPLSPDNMPTHPEGDCEARLKTRDGRLDGLFTVYLTGEDRNGEPERLLIAELFHDGEMVGGETATFDGTPVDSILSQARKIYASYWSDDVEIDWDSMKRCD